MNISKPLTPTLRRQIIEAFDRELRELNECQPNAFISVRRAGLQAYKNLITKLPDGYPIPMEKEK